MEARSGDGEMPRAVGDSVEGERRQRDLDRTGKMDPDGERRIIAGGSWHTEKVRRPQRPDPSNWR